VNIDTSIYADNNFFEKDIDYTIEKLCKILGKKLHVAGEFNNYEWAKEGEYINVGIEGSKSINEQFTKEHHLFFIIGKLEFLMAEKNIYFFFLDYKLGKWGNFAYHLTTRAPYIKLAQQYQNELEKIKYCSRLFNSTKMILFNDYDHQDIEDKLLAGEMTIDEAIKDKRWRIANKLGSVIIDDNDDSIRWSSNLIYYEQWENNDDFDIDLWKKEYGNL
jgi:hypothetical protein